MPSVQWEYFVQGLARDQRLDEVNRILHKLGKEGWELVSVLDQSEDVSLPHRTDARLLIFKRSSSSRSAAKDRDPEAAVKAADMAALELDKLADSSATSDQRQQRKRRLLKGPGEFRDMRGNRPSGNRPSGNRPSGNRPSGKSRK
jgi:hypothetical protein